MRPHQIVAGIAAAALLAAPMSGVASASASTTRGVAGHLSTAQIAALHAKMLPFVGYAKANQPVRFLVHLPLRNKAEAFKLATQMSTPKTAMYHKFLTPAQFAQRYGPSQADLQSAASVLRAAGFTVSKIDIQNVHASGSVAKVESFFGTRMGLVHDVAGGVNHVDARTPVNVPASLTRLNAHVIGLSAVPNFHADHAMVKAAGKPPVAPKGQRGLHTNAWGGTLGPYFTAELIQTYGEPDFTFANGTGMHIGIVGYSDSTDTSNEIYWSYEGIGPEQAFGNTYANYPTVNHFEFTGSVPPNTDGTSAEADLDAQMAGGSALGATIDQYAADESGNFGFLDVYSYIANNDVDDIITTSYSECELDYIYGYVPFYLLQAYDDTWLQGSMQGQTWLFSSGDNGAYACAYEGDYTDVTTSSLAADPNVTGVGGTTQLTTTYFDDGYGTGYASESSASDPDYTWGSGGGVSQLFTTPGYQTAIGLDPGTVNGTYGPPYGTGRQVPDISMHMGGPVRPFTADWVYSPAFGGWSGVIGTSASSPELAGWIAEGVTGVNASIGASGGFRVGQINNLFYYEQAIGLGTVAFNQYIPSDNMVVYYNPGSFCPVGCVNSPGYNVIIGVGTPNFNNLMGILGLTYPHAQDSITPSNP